MRPPLFVFSNLNKLISVYVQNYFTAHNCSCFSTGTILFFIRNKPLETAVKKCNHHT